MSVANLKKFDSLQIFRGLAALGVVIHHTAISTNAFVGNIPVWLNAIFEHGFLGVDFFFVLSGFIIMSSHYDDEKSVSALKTYGIKRFVRIFPPYWPISIALILAYWVLPGMSQATQGDYSWLSSLLLLPDAPPPALSVAWTLIHEVMFYMIFSLFFISSRVFLVFVAGWVMAIALVAWLAANTQFPPFFARLFSPINLEFVMGMGVAYLARGVAKHYAALILIFGGIMFSALLAWPFFLENRVLFGLPFSALVLGGILLEQQDKIAFPRPLTFLGDASYSIYLVHNPLVSLTSRLVSKMHGFASWGIAMLLGVIASVFVGVLYHWFVERPLISLFRRLFNRTNKAQ